MTTLIPHKIAFESPALLSIPKNKRAFGNVGTKISGCCALIASTMLFLISMKASEPAPSPAGDHSKSISIHQEIDFTRSAQQLYEALLDSKQFSAFSGRKAGIKREAGGEFSLFDSHIVGRNLELIPNKRIVQAWRVVSWPEGVYSIVKFQFENK